MTRIEAIDRQLTRLTAMYSAFNEFTPLTIRLETQENIKQLQTALVEEKENK